MPGMQVSVIDVSYDFQECLTNLCMRRRPYFIYIFAKFAAHFSVHIVRFTTWLLH